MCFDRSPTLTKALLHIWHLWGRTLSWCRMWLASWLDCTNLCRERHGIQSLLASNIHTGIALKGSVHKNYKTRKKHLLQHWLSVCWPFAATITHIGLLSSVLADVSDEWAGLGEGLATDETDTGLLSWKTWITVWPCWDCDNIRVAFQIEKMWKCSHHNSHSIACLNVMGVPVWMRSCRCRAPGSLKALWQCTQMYGFSPLWTRRCLFRFPAREMDPHKG